MNFGTFDSINWFVIFELFMLLLIGIGPKIALVPFVELTADLPKETQVAVANKSVRTAITWSLILVLLGWFLMVLLHFSTGSVLVAGGIVLMLLALHMLLAGGQEEDHVEAHGGKDPMDMALYPLAVPYLLNPVGIAVLVIASSQIRPLQAGGVLDVIVLVVLVLIVGLIDLLLFRNVETVSKFLDPAKMGVTEAVFGVLLAALAVELMVHGLVELGVISAHLATEEAVSLLMLIF
ncbi:MAG: MarC family protein [Candidatus Promineifilaceae bacterium]|jgi:small neutral amino acid transporter SnatA (MarC family)